MVVAILWAMVRGHAAAWLERMAGVEVAILLARSWRSLVRGRAAARLESMAVFRTGRENGWL